MSHAVVLVAIEGSVKRVDLEAAVGHEMEPFDESGECFRGGSRWDYWSIGGRWGDFFGHKRSVIRLRDWDEPKERELAIEDLRPYYDAVAKDVAAGKWTADQAKVVHGIDLAAGFGAYAESRGLTAGGYYFPSAYAFLRRRRWNEGERMGWFGMPAATECELEEKALAGTGVVARPPATKCLTRGPGGAVVVTWNDRGEGWGQNFHRRFIRPLAPDAWLVAVDYHV